MADSLLVCISSAQVSAAHWRGRRFDACSVFENSEAGLAAFREFLAREKRLPVRIMVDAVEEDYRFESLPHTFGSDRSELLTRKLKQHYRNTPYFSASLQGRDAGKRRDDRYLFCALTNPELVANWLKAVQERELPVVGIFLLPTVSAGLPETLGLKQSNLLVVSLHGAGLRLTYFRDQKLRISRLARTEARGTGAVKGYAEEISNTRLYLHALRVMTLDEQLSVLIVDRSDTLGDLAQTIARDSPNIDCRRIGRQEIASRLGIGLPVLESSNDALYLHLLGTHTPANNLAPAGVTAGFRQHQMRRGLYALAAVTALAISGWGALNAYQIFDTGIDIETAKRQTAELQGRYLEATRQFPAAPASADNLQRAVEISQKIGATTRSPERAMVLVSEALEQNPSIYVKSFGWKYDRNDFGSEAGLKAQPGAAAPAPAAQPPQTVSGPSVRRQSVLVDGEVRPFRGDYRAAIEAITRFSETMSKLPEVAEVKTIKLPLDINPALSLAGNTTESRDQAGRAEFKLIIVFKPEV